MNTRSNQTVGEQTAEILARGTYRSPAGREVDLRARLEAMRRATRLFTPAAVATLREREPRRLDHPARITLRNEPVLEAMDRVPTPDAGPGVLTLNFASATKPGGGFLRKAVAQEESIARATGLYASLLRAPAYYERNRVCGSALYTDHVILSGEVPVIRTGDHTLLDTPGVCHVLTAPAPNAGRLLRHEAEHAWQLGPVFRDRLRGVLAVAADAGYRALILGAWGCGVFRNPPRDVAGYFADELLPGGRFSRSFEHVHFAVMDRPGGETEAAFRERLRLPG